jgi:hypothetical protein
MSGNAEASELLLRLRALGLPTTSEIARAGETPESTRLRQLDVLQIYSRRYETQRLERLPGDRLETAEREIIEDATKTVRDWEACVGLLYRAGHRLTLIAELTRVPIETLHGWYPYAAPESPAAVPIPAPASAVRN